MELVIEYLSPTPFDFLKFNEFQFSYKLFAGYLLPKWRESSKFVGRMG